jgi:hypothetical protein
MLLPLPLPLPLPLSLSLPLLLLLLFLLLLLLLLLLPLLPLLVPPLLLLPLLVLLAPPLLLVLPGPWLPPPPLLLSLSLLLALPPALSVLVPAPVFARLALGADNSAPKRTRRLCILAAHSSLATSLHLSSSVLTHHFRYRQIIQATSLRSRLLSASSASNRTIVNSVTQPGPSPAGCDFGMQDTVAPPGSLSSPASSQ